MTKRIPMLLLALLLVCACFPSGVLAQESAPLTFIMEMVSEYVPGDDPVLKRIEEATGVTLALELPPANSYVERLNIVMASGDYPAIVQFPSLNDAAYINAMESGILLPLDEYIDEFENLKQYIDPVSYEAMRASSGGVLYGIPRNTVVRQDGFAVRKDWMDKLGIELPEDGYLTKDAFYDLLHAFTYGDPDGNGADDTYGYTDNSGDGNITPLFPYAFDCMGWQAHEGTYPYMNEMYCQEHDHYKDALAYTAKLWSEGLIDPNWPTLRGNSFRDRFFTGAVGVVRMFGGWLNVYEEGLKANFPDGEIAYITGIKNDDGVVEAVSSFGGNIYSFYGLTINCEGREREALAVLDYLLSDEGWKMLNYGVEGIHYEEDADGNITPLEAYSTYSTYRSYITLLRRYDDPAYFVPVSMTPDQKERAYQYIENAIAITVPDLSYGYRSLASQEAAYQDYASELSVAISKIIVGEQSPDTWDGALAGWYQNGGQDVVDQMITFIEANQ